MKYFYGLSVIFLVGMANPLFAQPHPVQITIGATLPLTGSLATIGEDIRQGMQLATEDFSTADATLTGIYDDNQQAAKQAIVSAKKLLDVDRVDALVSLWNIADVVAPLAEQKKIPHFAIRWDPNISKKFKYTFTVESTYQSYDESLLALLKDQGVRTVSLVTEEGQGWILAGDYLKERAKNFGITVLGDEHYIPDGLPEYKALLLRVLQKKPDVVVMLTNPPHTESLIKQMRETSPKQKFTGYFEIVSDPSLVEGIPFTAQFNVADWFVDKFRKRFGAAPRSRAAQAYDIVHLIALSAAQSHAKPTMESLAVAVKSPEFKTGAVGPLSLGNEKAIESQCVWKIAQGGSFILWAGGQR